MPVIYKSDLNNVDEYASSMLGTEKNQSQRLIDKIDDFVTNSENELKGESWDMERDRITLFKNALEKRKIVANSLLSAIKESNKMMREYFGKVPSVSEYSLPETDVINTEWINDLNNSIAEAYQNSEKLKQAGEDTSANDTLIAGYRTMIEYINGVTGEAASAYAKYENAISELDDFRIAVSNIKNDNYSLSEENDGTSDYNYTSTYDDTTYYKAGFVDSPTKVMATENNDTSGTSSGVNTKSTTFTNVGSSTQRGNVRVSSVNRTSSPIISASSNNSFVNNNATSITDDNITSIEDNSSLDTNVNTNLDNNKLDNNKLDNIHTNNYQKRNAKKKNVMKDIGIVTIGTAAAGAVGYGVYNTLKKVKDNNSFDDD